MSKYSDNDCDVVAKEIKAGWWWLEDAAKIIEQLRAERAEWKLKFELSCTTLGGEMERYRIGRDEARAQLKALQDASRHDTKCEGHIWTKKGTVEDGDFCKRCGALRPAGGIQKVS